MTGTYFPDELWRIIKDYQIEYFKHHSIKMKSLLQQIQGNYGELFQVWRLFPPQKNTSDFLQEFSSCQPVPNLVLTTITWNVKGTGGWWCGYGWGKGSERKRRLMGWT